MAAQLGCRASTVVRDELVCRSLKERSLASHVRLLVNDIDDLREAWNMLDTCFDRPEKYISEALDPVVKFRSYKAFDNGVIREFYSILRAGGLAGSNQQKKEQVTRTHATSGGECSGQKMPDYS